MDGDENAYMRDNKKYILIDEIARINARQKVYDTNKNYIIVEQNQLPTFIGKYLGYVSDGNKDNNTGGYVHYKFEFIGDGKNDIVYDINSDSNNTTNYIGETRPHDIVLSNFEKAAKYEEQTSTSQRGGKRNKTNKKRRNQKTKKSGRRRPFRK